MKLLARLFWLILTYRWRSRSGLLGPIDTQLRVYPNDLDLLLHVNNGVYLTYADLGRIDLLLRSGTFPLFRRKGWYSVAAGASIEFRKSLKLGQRFTIRTRIIGWNGKSVYFGQEFVRDDTTIASMMIDTRFLSTKGDRINTDQIVRELGVEHPSPEFPAALKQWIESSRKP